MNGTERVRKVRTLAAAEQWQERAAEAIKDSAQTSPDSEEGGRAATA